MAWLDPLALAQLYREVYVALIHSWVPHGQKAAYARRAGLRPPYLSFLLALEQPDLDPPPTRWASLAMAKRLADALPAPQEIRHSLLENMMLARVYNRRAYEMTFTYVEQRRVSEMLAELEQAHRRATFNPSPAQTRRAYHHVRAGAVLFVGQVSPTLYPAAFAQACLYLHDAQCVLDRADDALRHAKLARLALESAGAAEPLFSAEQFDNLYINAIRGEAVAYHNLGLTAEVAPKYEQALATPAYRNHAAFWAPLAGRDRLNALARTPRFSIRQALRLGRDLEQICERSGDFFSLFLVREALLRCLIQHQEWNKAEQTYQATAAMIPALPYVGQLHQALLLKSGAALAWAQRDEAAGQDRLRRSLSIMSAAGLDHQLREMWKQYGAALLPLREELGLDPAGEPGP